MTAKKEKKAGRHTAAMPNPSNATIDALLETYPNIPPNVLYRLNNLLGVESPRQMGRNLRDLFRYAMFPTSNGFEHEQLEELFVLWEFMEALCEAPPMRQDLVNGPN